MIGLAGLLVSRRHLWLWLSAMLALAAPVAQALEVTLSARYRGENSSAFEHTTPEASSCSYYPSMCSRNLTVDLPITYDKRTAVTTEPRQNFFIRFPERRQITLFSDQTGEAQQVTLNFTGVTQRVASQREARNPTTGYAYGDCTMQSGRWTTQKEYLYHWNINRTPAECWSRPARSSWGQVEHVTTSHLSVAYTLETLPTFRFRTGTYRGSVTYRVGPGGDFDFGDDVTALNDDSLTIHVVLEVEHSFRVEFPLDFDHARLEPPGGWTGWLDGGRVPPRIYNDLSMRMWSTGPFKVYKVCEYDVGDHCGIRNRRGEEVPLKVAITLPYGTRYQGWQVVNQWALPTGRAAALKLESILPTFNDTAQLHLEVAQDDVRSMLDRSGELYSGKVTVVFDAEL